MSEQIGLYKFKLTQKRYQDGAFYLSVVVDGEQVKAIDGRFYVEEGDQLTPTKSGFRIPIENLDAFRNALSGDLREIGDLALFENNAFRFHIRYMIDKYGEGVDLRKYRTTDKYTGWDRSGLRMKLEDITTMRDWLSDFDPCEIRSCDIFSGKRIGDRGRNNGNDSSNTTTEVSAAINKLLDF